MVRSILDNPFNTTAAHQLGDHVGLGLLLSKIEHGDDMSMGTKTTHSLGLSGDAGAEDLVQPLGLDEGEGHLSVQEGIQGQVDPLLASLSQEFLHLVPAASEGGRLVRDVNSGLIWNEFRFRL